MSDIIASAIPPSIQSRLDPFTLTRSTPRCPRTSLTGPRPSASPANSLMRLSAFTAHTSAKSVQLFTLTSPGRSVHPRLVGCDARRTHGSMHACWALLSSHFSGLEPCRWTNGCIVLSIIPTLSRGLKQARVTRAAFAANGYDQPGCAHSKFLPVPAQCMPRAVLCSSVIGC